MGTLTRIPPYDGTLRLYVDGTNGNDANSGVDGWGNAWKTMAKLEAAIAAINLAGPIGIELVARVRGAFANEDLFLLAQMQGASGIYIAHDFTDHTVHQTGTLNAVTLATEKHSITSLTLAGGIVLTAADLGRTIKITNAVGDIEGTSTIIKIDSVSNYCWTTKQTYPAWVVGGDVCTVKIVSPSMSGLRDVGMMLGEPTRMRYAPSAATTFRRPTLVGLKCEVLNMTGPGVSFGCHEVGVVTYPIRSEMGINTGVVTTTGMSAAYIAVLEDLGFTKGATGYCAIGNYVPNATTSCLYALGGYTSFYGYANQPPKIDQSAFCYVAVSNVPGTDSRQGGFAQFEYSISRGQCLVDVGGHGRFDRLSWDVPATGIAEGLVLVQDGGRATITANIEGDNDGTGTTLYGIQCKLGGLITGAGVLGYLKGKHGDLRVPDGRAVQTAAATIAARGGSGPDCYVGNLGQVEFQDNVTKSAVNSETAIQNGVDGKITAAGTFFESATAVFTAAHVGRSVKVSNSINPANIDVHQITAYTSPTKVVIGNSIGLVNEGPGLTWGLVGTARPILEVARGGRVSQAAGKTFSFKCPEVNPVTGVQDWNRYGYGYGLGLGFAYLHEGAEVCLGTLVEPGGVATALGLAAKIDNGSKLLHSGGAIPQGVQPLRLGGLAGPVAWPATPLSDALGPTPQFCQIIPNV